MHLVATRQMSHHKRQRSCLIATVTGATNSKLRELLADGVTLFLLLGKWKREPRGWGERLGGDLEKTCAHCSQADTGTLPNCPKKLHRLKGNIEFLGGNQFVKKRKPPPIIHLLRELQTAWRSEITVRSSAESLGTAVGEWSADA